MAVESTTGVDFVAFSVVIDDIVSADGRSAMTQLGGGGPQTAFGMKLWSDHVGLFARVGADLPASAGEWLRGTGIDTTGLLRHPSLPTLRAWQLMEADGRRHQVWRIPGDVIWPQLQRNWESMPPAYQKASGFHLGVHPENPDLEFIKALQSQGATVSVEPFRPTERPLTTRALEALVSAGQIFLPNELEAISLVGSGEPEQLVRRLAEAGAALVVLRRGADGSLVYHADTGEMIPIPALATTVVDPLGAGNAYCGGFLAGWVQTADLLTAGRYGAIAASFLVEQVGLPVPSPTLREEAARRLSQLGMLSPSEGSN